MTFTVLSLKTPYNFFYPILYFFAAMVAGGVALIQLSGLCLACQLASRLKNLPD